MKAQRGRRVIALLFLYPRLWIWGGGGQGHIRYALTPGKRALAHCTGGWVGLRGVKTNLKDGRISKLKIIPKFEKVSKA